MIKKPHTIVFYAICSFVFFFVISVYSQSASPDAASMEALKKSLSLTADLDWSNPNPCEWADVQCDKTGRITRIQLVQRGISGTLVPDLKNLSSLIILELMLNKLTGPIPSLAGLKSLQRLNLHDNGFISIPVDFFSGMSSLQTVILDNNPFVSWEIPESLKEATSLQEFSAVNCNLTGAIPDFFDAQTFPSLTTLHISHNSLQGGLPISLSGSPIQSLFVNGQNGAQKLNGSISILQNMTSLTEIWLHGNQFSGPIPDISRLVSLRNFSGRDNQLSGIVPSSLYNSQSLFIVNLTNNLLQGPTPNFDTKRVIVDMTAGSNSFCLDDPGVPCDPRIDILLSIVEAFGYPLKFAQNWKGNDPCDNWLGITCSGGEITVVNFKNMGLIGSISPSLANLTSLRTINFAQNSLTGTIPTELTTLPELTTLDVSNNNLYGKLPGFRQNVVVRTEGNPDFGKDAPSNSVPSSLTSGSGTSGNAGGKKSNSTGIIAGSVVSVVVGLSAIATLLTLYIKKKSRYSKVQNTKAVVVHPHDSGNQNVVKIAIASSGANGAASGSESQSVMSSGPSSDMHLVEAGNMVISIQVLREVTSNFSEKNILGRGGFGTVYKGELPDGTKIAVKRMESSVVNDKGLTEFKSEIAVLTKVRHRNLVALIGYCLDGNERLLVYEYMPQGTLSRHLFHWKEEGLKPLEWTKRLILGLDVARGVEYLHTLAHQSFIHRDLKPTNILLGDDMRAKVADFGLVRLAPDGEHSIETRLAGTFGYLAPEYAVTGRVTTKVDVFSFGVILMEMITGRRALDDSQHEDNIHLVTWFKRMYINRESLQKSIDQTIEITDETLTSIHKVAELACHCCAREPHQRPDMGHVVNVLSSLVEQWKPSEREDADDVYGIDYNTPLPRVVKKWRELEGSGMDDSSSSFFGSNDNTETSIPTRPSNLGDTFASGDGR